MIMPYRPDPGLTPFFGWDKLCFLRNSLQREFMPRPKRVLGCELGYHIGYDKLFPMNPPAGKPWAGGIDIAIDVNYQKQRIVNIDFTGPTQNGPFTFYFEATYNQNPDRVMCFPMSTVTGGSDALSIAWGVMGRYFEYCILDVVRYSSDLGEGIKAVFESMGMPIPTSKEMNAIYSSLNSKGGNKLDPVVKSKWFESGVRQSEAYQKIAEVHKFLTTYNYAGQKLVRNNSTFDSRVMQEFSISSWDTTFIPIMSLYPNARDTSENTFYARTLSVDSKGKAKLSRNKFDTSVQDFKFIQANLVEAMKTDVFRGGSLKHLTKPPQSMVDDFRQAFSDYDLTYDGNKI